MNPSCKPLHILLFNLSLWTKLALREGDNQLCPSFRLSNQKKKKITFQASTTRNTFMSGWPDKWVPLLTADESVQSVWQIWPPLCFAVTRSVSWSRSWGWTGVFYSHYYLVEKGGRSGLMVQCGRGVPIWTSHPSLVRSLGPYPKVQATHLKNSVTWLLWMCYLWAKGSRNTCNDIISVSTRNRGYPLPLLRGRSSWGRENSNLAEV